MRLDRRSLLLSAAGAALLAACGCAGPASGAAAQAALDQLRVENRDVRARYDTISETGFGFAAEGSAYYNVLPRTRIGGEINYNTFGDYDEFKLGLGVRQTVGGGQ